jgi:hypothetical protein
MDAAGNALARGGRAMKCPMCGDEKCSGLACPEAERLRGLEKILNTPELNDFAKGVELEAKHQRARWGDEHDTEKEPEEWFWVVGYLAGKALRAQRDGDLEKFKHHLITGAAIMANWHARVLERQT